MLIHGVSPDLCAGLWQPDTATAIAEIGTEPNSAMLMAAILEESAERL
jgi:hypothetical protein